MEEEIDIYARSMHVITNCVGVGRLVLASTSQEPTPHDSRVILPHSVHTLFDTHKYKYTQKNKLIQIQVQIQIQIHTFSSYKELQRACMIQEIHSS